VVTTSTETHSRFRIVYRLVAAFLIALVVAACTSSERDEPSVDTVSHAPIVVVFNGCGAPGAARAIAEALRAEGWDIGNGYGENAESFDYPDTFVVDYVGDRETAQRIAEKLGTFMIQQISHDPDRFGTVGVIVGADYRARVAQLLEG